jgi:hypothetical protein
VTVEEYYRWIFEQRRACRTAAKEGLAPLEYMRKYGAFEIKQSL